MARNCEVKTDIFANFKQQWDARINKVATKTREEIEKFFKSSHYFLGTEAEEGMYYSHYLKVLGEPNIIEEKIKETRKAMNCVEEVKRLKRRPGRPPLWRSKYYITSVGPYFTRFDVKKQEEKEARENRLFQQDFIVYARQQDKIDMFKGPTIRVQTDYEHGKVKDQKRWTKISDKPFMVCVPRRRRFSCGGL
ncbi:uncharacterized protein LOC112345445 [Selaginella moellendorffii]|uniref:uncharacterized protein LOC112345445 n=1 Tax=Selaginella moellendorffii TaxID=88036 RepID=UPI000D1CA104|nr:uncharacterized protein LOC112345445 [Selaginella moellendorffii]|eukprot:XP_024527967.1 uncharacterized protein LOC112345445 [Selaginella moellendorffii]